MTAALEPWETPRIVVMVPLYMLVLFVNHMVESERQLRIARDMHDQLGHQITVQILNLEVATHHAQGLAL